MAGEYVPPGGYIGAGSQTQAAQLLLMGRGSRSSKRRKRRKTGSKRRSSGSKKRSMPSRRMRLVKGSRAAKAYMAKLRRMRKR